MEIGLRVGELVRALVSAAHQVCDENARVSVFPTGSSSGHPRDRSKRVEAAST